MSRADRFLWVLLSQVWTGWRRSVQIVQPATVVRWHRRAFALHWRWRSRHPGVGRPAVAPDVRALIRQMRSANPLWGAPRIHGELRKLGIEVSQTTVAKYVGRRRTPPSPTWRAFLTTHVAQSASIDFFTVPTATFRVLFVLVVLSGPTRNGPQKRRWIPLCLASHVDVPDPGTLPNEDGCVLSQLSVQRAEFELVRSGEELPPSCAV